MDECRNAMLHQILSDCHPDTFSKSKKKGWSKQRTLVAATYYALSVQFEFLM